jgi:hypothetical protein
VSEACKNILFEYLCIYNSNDLPPREWSGEEWYNRSQRTDTYNQLSKWNKDQEAQLMFNELKEKTSSAYCSLIKGLAKVNSSLSRFHFVLFYLTFSQHIASFKVFGSSRSSRPFHGNEKQKFETRLGHHERNHKSDCLLVSLK